MQKHVEQAKTSPSHIRRNMPSTWVMNENPQVPNYVSRETHQVDFRLEPGLTLAVEPMINIRGEDEVDAPGDNWTVVTCGRMPSVHRRAHSRSDHR